MMGTKVSYALSTASITCVRCGAFDVRAPKPRSIHVQFQMRLRRFLLILSFQEKSLHELSELSPGLLWIFWTTHTFWK